MATKQDLIALQLSVSGEDKKIVDAVLECGSATKAALALGKDRRTVDRRLKRLLQSFSAPPFTYTPPKSSTGVQIPEGRVLGKTTTLYGPEGDVRLEWVATHPDEDWSLRQIEAIRDGLASEIPRASPVAKPANCNEDLATAYILTDYHLGMLAWGEETGADWDLDIAESTLVNWFSSIIKSTPDSKYAVLAQMGDFMHWDGLDAVTPTSKHVLDADTRFEKLTRTAIRCLRQVIATLLTKHEQVHVIVADANHDPASSSWMRALLPALYENEPRISINTRADGYYCYEHGLTSLFFHHGHKRGVPNVDSVFTAKYRDVFGRTKFSYAHLGHRHSVEMRESPLMIVEQHPTLAAPDAYASRSGFISMRSASAITYHSKFGYTGRVVITPDMVTY